jgi:hypothetical protein
MGSTVMQPKIGAPCLETRALHAHDPAKVCLAEHDHWSMHWRRAEPINRST